MSSAILRSITNKAVTGVIMNSALKYPSKTILRYVNLVSVDNLDTSIRKTETSKAMKSYLERATAHDEFMKQQEHEFKIGKRHLANMMGEDPDTFTQEDVNRAIEYLFPSGIYSLNARPMMKPPDKVFPPKKAAEFDEAGRPHHFLFYTTKCNFFKILYDIAEHLEELHRFEDEQMKKNIFPDPNMELELHNSDWISKTELETRTVETLMNKEYDSFISAMNRLVATPYSYNLKNFIFQFREDRLIQQRTYEIPQPLVDENGRKYITVYECLRRHARGIVTIKSPGTGKMSINGKGIEYFEDIEAREQVLFPLIFTGMLNTVDIECTVERGGPMGQSGAIRWGISWGLRSFVDSDMVQKLRLAGLLSRDPRRHERKKVCQPGARKKHTWKKR